jgi:xylulose-5-phosphate/fructose-6-phosphate phosphoketolase
MDVADRVPSLAGRAAYLKQRMRDKRIEHAQYIVEHGEDMPEVRDWKWTNGAPARATTPRSRREEPE